MKSITRFYPRTFDWSILGVTIITLSLLNLSLADADKTINGGGNVHQRSREKRTVLFSGWQPREVPLDQLYYPPRTENYYEMKPEAVVEILMDPEDDLGYGRRIVEHSAITTSIQSESEYRASCVKEPGCRWECEPRQDELPPDCDCVCFYTDSKWDTIP